MSVHDPILPTAAPQIRVDGWSPARQRRFLETLAATGVIMLACEAVRITTRSAYALRTRHDGAAFRLGWDAAILIARARLATDLLARAIMGNEETIRKDPDNHEVTRHRHDNRLAMSMLARLDRMADSPAEGSDAALARVVAQDFAAYLDLICPEEELPEEIAQPALPRAGAERSACNMADAQRPDGAHPDTPEPAGEAAASALSPGAAAALFISARMAIHRAQNPLFSVTDERCELRPEPEPDLSELPPEEAVTRLRGVWWDDLLRRQRTDFPPPPGFAGDATSDIYDIDDYARDLTPEEAAEVEAQHDAWRLPYEIAAAQARDAYFARMPAEADDAQEDADAETGAGAIPVPA